MTPLQVQANRFQLVSRIADDLAHEIKNPLHGMVINLELMKRRALAGKSDEVVQRAEFVSSEIMRVNALIDHLLALVRPPRNADLELVDDVDQLVGDLLPVLEAQARLSGVQLVYEGVGSTAGAPIRRDALRLVLLNLFAAALERARAAGGRIRVSAGRAEGALRMVVSDSGAGSTHRRSGRLSPSEGREDAAPDPPGGAGEVAGTQSDASRDAAGVPPDGAGEPEDGDMALGLAVARYLVEEAGGVVEERPAGSDERLVGVSFPATRPLDPGSRAPVL